MTSKTMNDPKGKGLAAGRVDVKKLATMAMLVALAVVSCAGCRSCRRPL